MGSSPPSHTENSLNEIEEEEPFSSTLERIKEILEEKLTAKPTTDTTKSLLSPERILKLTKEHAKTIFLDVLISFFQDEILKPAETKKLTELLRLANEMIVEHNNAIETYNKSVRDSLKIHEFSKKEKENFFKNIYIHWLTAQDLSQDDEENKTLITEFLEVVNSEIIKPSNGKEKKVDLAFFGLMQATARLAEASKFDEASKDDTLDLLINVDRAIPANCGVNYPHHSKLITIYYNSISSLKVGGFIDASNDKDRKFQNSLDETLGSIATKIGTERLPIEVDTTEAQEGDSELALLTQEEEKEKVGFTTEDDEALAKALQASENGGSFFNLPGASKSDDFAAVLAPKRPITEEDDEGIRAAIFASLQKEPPSATKNEESDEDLDDKGLELALKMSLQGIQEEKPLEDKSKRKRTIVDDSAD